jgi:CTP synthase
MVKYVFVTGGVLSSVGKGILTSSIGKMLQARGLKVTVIKIDPYVNVDAGTMNPYMHGEVFVTNDGGETDLDLGWYERFLDLSLKQENNLTTGSIYKSVIEKERRGDFLGRCVQIIPHITNEIKNRIKAMAKTIPNVDVVLTEVGGTVGDIEGLPFLEAIRQMRLEEGYENTLYVHVALVPVLDVTGEMKTKPLQHSVNELRRIGIQPDTIVARSPTMIDAEALRKIALFGTIPESAVFCSYNAESVYQVPLILDKQGMGDFICQRFGYKCTADFAEWKQVVDAIVKPQHEVKIALVGKYAGLSDSYVSMTEALRHGGGANKTRVCITYLEAEKFEQNPQCIDDLKNYDGVFVPYGFGPRGTEGKIAAIKLARENDIPFLGICYGFQLATIEFARNVCGLKDANSTEINPNTPHPVIDLMPEQRGIEIKGATMRLGAHKIILEKDTLADRLYKTEEVYERHRHRFEVNLDYLEVLCNNGMIYSGKSTDGRRMETMELPSKYFYFASQFHGEFKSRPGRPSPEYFGFINACLNKKMGKAKPTFA